METDSENSIGGCIKSQRLETLRKNWKKALILAVASSFFLLLLWWSRSAPIDVRVEGVKPGVVEEWVETEGFFRSREVDTVSAFAEGDLTRVRWKVGDPIRKGDAVAELYWDMKKHSLRAPMGGVVSRVFRESAGPIRRGEPVIEILDPDDLEIRTDLLTPDAAQVEVEDVAKVMDWSSEWSEGDTPQWIPARVVRVSRAGFVKPSSLGVEEERTEVILRAENPKEPLSARVLNRVGDRFHVKVRIQTQNQEVNLRVPVGALLRDGTQWAVFRVHQGKANLIRIGLGLRGNDYASVQSGLDLDDQVILYPGDEIEEGVRVRLRD